MSELPSPQIEGCASVRPRMTWAEALRVLGITPEVGFKDARRAYLQLIKVHKPEQDPEGFQRVREAFELVGPVLQARERGAPEALPAVVAPVPAAVVLTDGAVSELQSAEERVDRAVQLLRAQNLDAAVPELLQALEVAARFPTQVHLPGDLVLRAIGDLGARGECIRARHVTDAVRAWVQALPSARQAFSLEGLPRWVLLAELVRAEDAISTPTYQALAKAITLNGEEATRDLELRPILNPRQSTQDHLALIKAAPTLAKTFGNLLDPPAPASAAPAKGSWRFSWMLVIVAAQLLRMCTSLFSDDHQGKRDVVLTSPPPPTAVPRGVLAPIQPGQVDSAKVEETGQALQSALVATGDRYRTDDAVDGLLHGECEQAGNALAELAQHTRGLGTESRAGLQVLWAEFEIKCPGQMKTYEP